MKRFLSLLLACMMVLSMVTIAHADEATEATQDITITYWNANTTTVVLELSRKVESAEVLKNAMTISGFTADDFEVYEQTTPKHAYSDEGTHVYTYSGKDYSFRKLERNNTTYTVQLDEGKSFAFGTEYTLTVAESLFGATNELKFTVNKIAVENFAGAYWHGNSGSTVSVANNELSVKGNAKVNNSDASGANFADTTVLAKSWRNDSGNPVRDKINMEVKVAVTNADANHHVSVGFANNAHTWSIQSGSMSEFAGVGFGSTSGKRAFSVFVAKAGSDPEYNGTGTQGVYYAAQSHGSVQGNMIYNTSQRMWPEEGKTTPFESGVYKNMAFFWDATDFDADGNCVADGRVTLGVENLYYSYYHDMENSAIRANPFLMSTTDAKFKDLILSYPTGTIRTFKYTTVEVAAPIYWTAASDNMTLIFATEVDADALEEAITLKDVAGEEVDVTVTKLTDITKASQTYNKGRSSYRIDLPERFVDDATYTLEISSQADIVNDGDEYTICKLAQDYVLNFKVDLVVVEGFDYTEGDVAGTDGESDFAWCIATSSNRNGTMTIKKDGTNMYAEVTATGKTYFAPYADNDVEFANTDMDGLAYTTSDYLDMTEYTTEIDLKVVSSTDTNSAYDFRMDQTQMAYSTAYNKGYNESMLGMHVWKSTTPSYTMRPAGHSLEKGGNYLTYSQQSSGKSALWPAVGATDYTRVAMSSDDNNFRFWVGDSITNIEDFTYTTPPRKGIPAFWFNTNNTAGATVVYHIDDLILSKATEVVIVPETTIESIVVTVDGEQVDSLEAADTVDVVVTVNRTVSAAPLKAVLAVYGMVDGVETMTNVYTNKEATTLNVGENTITFTNVELNGGNTINVFFWDSFEKLIPYTTPVVFPAAE